MGSGVETGEFDEAQLTDVAGGAYRPAIYYLKPGISTALKYMTKNLTPKW